MSGTIILSEGAEFDHVIQEGKVYQPLCNAI
jgi:hypothetical protein